MGTRLLNIPTMATLLKQLKDILGMDEYINQRKIWDTITHIQCNYDGGWAKSWGMEKWLHYTENYGCNYLSMHALNISLPKEKFSHMNFSIQISSHLRWHWCRLVQEILRGQTHTTPHTHNTTHTQHNTTHTQHRTHNTTHTTYTHMNIFIFQFAKAHTTVAKYKHGSCQVQTRQLPSTNTAVAKNSWCEASRIERIKGTRGVLGNDLINSKRMRKSTIFDLITCKWPTEWSHLDLWSS